MSLATSLASTAPLYNLGFVLIAIVLFVRLFRTPIRDKRVYLLPWKLLFVAVLIFVTEEVLTVLRGMQLINIPVHINGFFEVIIITIFIYAMLLQRESMKRR